MEKQASKGMLNGNTEKSCLQVGGEEGKYKTSVLALEKVVEKKVPQGRLNGNIAKSCLLDGEEEGQCTDTAP